MTGILIQNGDRPDIAFDSGTLYGGLHCGDCFDVYSNHWIRVRLEYLDSWIIIYDDRMYPPPYGARVRI